MSYTSRSISQVGTVEPWELQVARGQILGHSVLNLFGYIANVGTTYVPLWGVNSVYTFPTQGLVMTVTSDATDDGKVIVITGLDEDYNIVSEQVTLDNGTPPTTAQEFFRVNSVMTLDANGSSNPTNNVTIANGGTTYAQIIGGEGASQSTVYTVPAGYAYYLNRISGFSGTSESEGDVLLRNRVGLPNGVVLNVGQTSFYQELGINRQYPFRYAEKTDLQIQVRSISGTNRISVFAEGVLIQEELPSA